MKIAIVELMPYQYTLGGGTTHITNLAKALIQEGHGVHVITSKKNYIPVISPPDKIIIHNIGLPHKKFGDLKGILKIYDYFYRFLFEAFFVISSLKKIRQIKPDIIDSQSMALSALPAALSNYPFIITAHGIFYLGIKELYKRKNMNLVSKHISKFYTLIEKYNLKKAKIIVSQAEETLNYYKNIAYKKKYKPLFKILPNPLDTEKFKPGNTKIKNQLICIARFTKQKGLDKLLMAMKYLPDYNLLLIGDGELRPELEALSKNLKNVKLLGILSPEKYIPLVQESEFFILASEFEGLPYAVVESMSMGTIPIVTKVGNLSGLVKDKENGFFFNSNSPEDIAKKIKEAKKYDLKKISKNARNIIVKNYSLNHVAKLFISTYQEAIKQ